MFVCVCDIDGGVFACFVYYFYSCFSLSKADQKMCTLQHRFFIVEVAATFFSIMLFGVKMLLFSVSFNGAITSIKVIMGFRPVSW